MPSKSTPRGWTLIGNETPTGTRWTKIDGPRLCKYEKVEVVPANFTGLLTILDEHYPAAVFTGESEDVGARLVVLARELALLRDAAQAVMPYLLMMCQFPGATEATEHLRVALATNEREDET